MTVRLAWLGNLGNVGFNYVKLLNRFGSPATLFVEKGYLDAFQVGNPEYEYVNASKEKFVEVLQKDLLGRILNKIGISDYLNTFEVRIGKQCNIVQAQTLNELFAYRIRKRYNIPYVSMTTGADLSEVAFEDSALGERYRKALREAAHIFLVNIDQFAYIRKLSFQNIPHSFLPFNINASTFKPVENIVGNKIVFLSVARLDWTSKDRHSIKRNDIFFRGFANYVKKFEADTFELWIADWGIDKDETRILIERLGIQHITKFVPVGNKEYFYKLLKDVNVVVDQFHLGAIGLAALEAMAMSRPVFAYCNSENAVEAYGREAPIINCRTEQDVFENLKGISVISIREKSQQVFEWIREYHSEERIFNQLTDVYKDVLLHSAR